MKFSQAFKMSIKSIMSNKMRSFLTMLGIIIGVGAVIMLVSLVQGSTNTITDKIESMGTNMIIVSLKRTYNSNRVVKVEDMIEYVEEKSEYFNGVSPAVTSSVTVKNGTENLSTSLIGCNEVYQSVQNLELSSGRFLTGLEVSRRQKVAVIGTYQVKELFDGENPLNQTIKVNGEPFVIVGILEEKADGEQGTTDDRIIVPYTVAGRILKNMNITQYYVEAADKEIVDMAVVDMKQFLYGVYSNEDSYAVVSQSQMLEVVGEITGIMTTLLAGIASISLLVGGIGIMNIMLVSVTERTREIGIRKAIGAKRNSILTQFLIEAIVVSCLGGIIGIIFGQLGAMGLGKMFNIDAAASPGAIGLSFMFSVAIGVFFGWYPANKASKLNPIEALRHE